MEGLCSSRGGPASLRCVQDSQGPQRQYGSAAAVWADTGLGGLCGDDSLCPVHHRPLSAQSVGEDLPRGVGSVQSRILSVFQSGRTEYDADVSGETDRKARGHPSPPGIDLERRMDSRRGRTGRR